MGLQGRVDGECVGQRRRRRRRTKKKGNSMDRDMQERCCSWTNEGSCFVYYLLHTKNHSRQDEKGSKAMAPEALGNAALSPHGADTDRVGVEKGSVAHAVGGGGDDDGGERESQEDNNQIQCREKRRAQGALAHSDDTQVDSGSCGCCCCACRNEA